MIAKAISRGPKGVLQWVLKRMFPRRPPLSTADRKGFFLSDDIPLHRFENRDWKLKGSVSRTAAGYPLEHAMGLRRMRYALRRSRKSSSSKSLIVLFHGHLASTQGAPARSCERFDLLAPWDVFGLNGEGSWFWGDSGTPTTEEILHSLIRELVSRNGYENLFMTGASMGGFAAIWHGIKLGAKGVYAISPQVDLRKKVADFGGPDSGSPYARLAGETGEFPDLPALVHERTELPPLFLVGNQFDRVNDAQSHYQILLSEWIGKRAWMGVRLHPSLGHGADGSLSEAELFFDEILRKRPHPSPPVIAPA